MSQTSSHAHSDPAPRSIAGSRGAAIYGFLMAVAALAFDQAYKYWMIEIYGIGERGRVALTPFFDLVLAWN